MRRSKAHRSSASPPIAQIENAKTIKMTCRKAMWWGTGAPAGLCGEPAYGPERYSQKDDRTWTMPELARCPLHGGPTIEEFHQWLMKQILAE